jgi:metallo-beta-lactamase family protein
MKLGFYGACRTVTGSKFLLSLPSKQQILIDCGLFQGLGKQTDELNAHFGFNPAHIATVLLTHAHIDHSGLIPKLVKEGFKGKIYATPATLALTAVLLKDSAEIQRDDTEYLNKKRKQKNLPLLEPLYLVEDVDKALPFFSAIPYNKWFSIHEEVEVLFTNTGHITGSAAVHIRIKENNAPIKQISFSGDVGRYNDVLLKPPEPFPQTNYLIIESTYGNRLHEPTFHTSENLLKWIAQTCEKKKGKLIIPAFSVGRTQELLYYLNELQLENLLPKVPVYVDSPLSREATMVVKEYPENFNHAIQTVLKTDSDPFDFEGLHFIKSVEESKQLNERTEPCIIIAASGMADAGRIQHHIKNNVESEKNTILIVGYCEPSSLGGRLMRGEKQVKIFGELYHVAAEVGIIQSMSAHGDYADLLQFVSCQQPQAVETVFIVHGEYAVQQEFQKKLTNKGFRKVLIPALYQTIEL